MDSELTKAVVDLGGTVAVVGIFIYYLINRNSKQEKAMREVSESLGTLHKAQETHTKVLMRVADNHGNHSDVEKLIDT